MGSKRKLLLGIVAAGTIALLSMATPARAASSAIELISVTPQGFSGDDGTSSSAISGNGRYVVMLSAADNLTSQFIGGSVYVRDRATQTTTPVAVSSTGALANDGGYYASINTDGRYIAFSSSADNLVPGDTNEAQDIFVRDVRAKTTTRVSLSTAGVAGNQQSTQTAINGDGRFVAFISDATNLVPGDTNGVPDLFVYDRSNSTIRRASVSSTGQQANAAVVDPAISPDGRYVSFWSAASNLVPGDTDGVDDAFVRDLRTGTTTRVSVSSTGAQSNAARGQFLTGPATLSSGGRYVAFASSSTDLVPGDTNGVADVFVRDRTTGTTTLLSRTAAGALGNGTSSSPSISADGRYVAYGSEATNLVPGDTNDAEDIFLRDVSTSQVTRLNITATGEQANIWSYGPHLSSDGRVVAFTSGASNLVPGDFNENFDIFARQIR